MNEEKFKLPSGVVIPKLAYGTGTKWGKMRQTQAEQETINNELVDSILNALRLGFTHIDTAENYATESEVGIAVQKYLLENRNKSRTDLFITTKIRSPPTFVLRSFAESLKKLGPAIEGYVDLLLIHWPFWDYSSPESTLTMKQVWSEMESLVECKKVRAIGVSNWRIQDFEAILALNPKVLPEVDQIEFHAYCQSVNLLKYLSGHGILNKVVIEAYGPLQPLVHFAESGKVKAVVEHIATTKGTGVSASQVLLAWGFAKGIVQVTTSSKAERLKEAVEAQNLSLSQEELDEISAAGAKFQSRKFWTDKNLYVFDD